MKHLFLGNGSIGKRHQVNLLSLRPDADILAVDPVVPAHFETIYDAVNSLGDFSDCVAYICSPFEYHWHQYHTLISHGAKAIFCEKPFYSVGDPDRHHAEPPDIPFACGYNHRYHPLFRKLYSLREHLYFFHLYGTENISAKYGDTALETMLSHSLDLGLWLFGSYEKYSLIDVGVQAYFRGVHRYSPKEAHIAAVSMQADMLSMYRVATCSIGYANPETEKLERHLYGIEKNDQMYLDEMKAWLHYVETGDAGDLCTFQQALKVQEIMNNRNRGEIRP